MKVHCLSIRFALAVICLAALTTSGVTPAAAQDSDDNAAAAEAAPDDDSQEASEEPDAAPEKEADPFAVPEGASVEELFEHIRKVKSKRGRTMQSVVKAASAAVAAAEQIRDHADATDEQELKAVREQLAALDFLSRANPASREKLKDLLQSLMEDEREPFQVIGKMEGFKSRITEARSASPDEQAAIVEELWEMVGDGEIDSSSYSMASSLARAIGGTDSLDLAAGLYEELSTRMESSSDERVRARAPKMMGAARRIRLPGNFMEITATTTDGDPFDWDSYRGKVVLVDFWASWCGPCRAEIPNMKKNLERYGELGFDIVGVNLDKTPAACAKYVENEELTWTNLMSEDTDQMGWDNPLATYYGVNAIPTAILVDQEGKVVSLRARGKELDRLLVELLGEVNDDANDDDAAPEDAEDEPEGDEQS